MKILEKVVVLRRPFLFVAVVTCLTACSTSKKQFYFFDHHTYSVSVKDTVGVDAPPPLYASAEPVTAGDMIPSSSESTSSGVIIVKRNNFSKRSVFQKNDSLPDLERVLREKEDRKTLSVIGLWSRKKVWAIIGILLGVGGLVAAYMIQSISDLNFNGLMQTF